MAAADGGRHQGKPRHRVQGLQPVRVHQLQILDLQMMILQQGQQLGLQPSPKGLP